MWHPSKALGNSTTGELRFGKYLKEKSASSDDDDEEGKMVKYSGGAQVKIAQGERHRLIGLVTLASLLKSGNTRRALQMSLTLRVQEILTENKMKKGIIVSGYFNPIHKGHLEYFNNAKANGDLLFVIVNNDHQRAIKGSAEFQGEEERLFIVSNIKAVDHAVLSVDQDRTVCATSMIRRIWVKFGIGFRKWGDQNNDTIPERAICESLGIDLIDGLGDKIQSVVGCLTRSEHQNYFIMKKAIVLGEEVLLAGTLEEDSRMRVIMFEL